MLEQIEALRAEVEAYSVEDEKQLESYKRRFTNKKAVINELFVAFRALAPEEKKAIGKPLNTLKSLAQDRLAEFQQALQKKTSRQRPTS